MRFLDTPPGDGHCAFFAVNVVTPEQASALGIAPSGARAYLVADALSEDDFRGYVTHAFDVAFARLPRSQALALLDERFVWCNQDFREEFRNDAPAAEVLASSIESAFAGVTRGDGVSLHEALAEDDYATAGERAAARARDVDTDWHDVPRDVLSANAAFFSYLDAAGYRYYLPAVMRLSLDAAERLRSETPRRAFWSLLPSVAPRDFGKGRGARFDVEKFIARRALTDAQVSVTYGFLCFMAVSSGEGVDEEQLPAMRQWRHSARRRIRA